MVDKKNDIMIIDGGYEETCLNCNTVIRQGDICKCCGTSQVDFREKSMVKNLLEFGFTPVTLYKKQNFIQRIFFPKKIDEVIYVYQMFIAKKSNMNNSNRIIFFKDKQIEWFNEYGIFSYVSNKWKNKLSPYMAENNIEMRDKKLEEIL